MTSKKLTSAANDRPVTKLFTSFRVGAAGLLIVAGLALVHDGLGPNRRLTRPSLMPQSARRRTAGMVVLPM